MSRAPLLWIARILLVFFIFSFAQTRLHPGASAQTSSGTGKKAATSAPPKPSGQTYSARAARARRARLARARAAARARQLRELQTPRFRVDENGNLVPDVRAEAAILYNPATGEVIWEENAQNQRSIASITKVMTALVFLENDPDLSQTVTITRDDVRAASVTYLRRNERITLSDLLHLALIASDNAAARALARLSAYGYEGFVPRLNERAAALGLENTHYADPSGLDPGNVSSAYDMARLIAYASGDERVASVMRKAEAQIRTSRRTLTVRNTNQLVGDFDVRGGKTGFIANAGYCLATLLQLPDLNQQVAVVVLGARSNAGRFWEARHLLNWVTDKLRSGQNRMQILECRM